MNYPNCKRRIDCVFLALAASVIVGIVTAILTFTAIITVTPVFYWVAFGIAVGYLALTLVTAPLRNPRARGCSCDVLNFLLTGVLGTVFTALLLLAVGFAATSVLGAIITGLLLGFFTLTLTTTACLAKCGEQCDQYVE